VTLLQYAFHLAIFSIYQQCRKSWGCKWCNCIPYWSKFFWGAKL